VICHPMRSDLSRLAAGRALYIAPNIEQGLREPGALLPLQTRGGSLGVLVIIGSEGAAFSPDKVALFQSIADQLSIAVDNARLFQKNEQAAIAAERNRLARDLHDAVTQTLFSASMIAEVLPKIWDDNPEEGRHRLEELRQLTRGALSEMRTLLLELRPAALTDTDLGDLIRHQVNAFIARTRLAVTYERDCTTNPPVAVKEALYRIAQEAFNNIAKHAEATQVMVRLECQPGRAELWLQDNGVGFDLYAPDHEGLGLGIMQERARNVAAQIEISSQPHQGASLRVVWQEDGA
jgi:signal transduction histidine kinase